MSLEAIRAITNAEEQARQIQVNAANLAKRNIAAEHEAGEASIASARAKAADELKALSEQADIGAKSRIEQLGESTENRKAAMRAKAEAKMEEAARMIVERIVSS